MEREVPAEIAFKLLQGRVLHECVVFAGASPDTYYVECDRDSTGAFMKHLRRYALRKKFKVRDLTDELCVAAALAPVGSTTNDLADAVGSSVLAGGPDPRLAVESTMVPGTSLSLHRFVLPVDVLTELHGKVCPLLCNKSDSRLQFNNPSKYFESMVMRGGVGAGWGRPLTRSPH